MSLFAQYDRSLTRVELARLEGTLQTLVTENQAARIASASRDAEYQARIAILEAANADHETRIRAGERWRYAVPVAAIAGLISGAASLIAILVH